MFRKIIIGITICTLNLNGLLAQESFKLMFYNLLNFPIQDIPSNRIQYLELILDDYKPDVLMVCELNFEAASNDILLLMQSINPNFSKAVFVNNTSDDSGNDLNELQNLLYYDSSKFSLESQAVITTLFRDFNHYKLKLNTLEQSTDPIYLDAIVCHLKASSGSDNEALRLQMINDLELYLETFPSDSKVILAGDFNMYTSSESGFVELLDVTNNIVFTDPANRIGSWHNNPNYVDVMTQSTRTQSGLGGATGGLDDRFDFIMTTQNLISDTDLQYVSDSYKVWGNNKDPLCFNSDINSSDCAGPLYSLLLRDALYNFSDHLPVTLKLETDQTLSSNAFILESPIQVVGSNLVNNTLQLKINNNLLSNQTLNVYDSIGRLIKTINTKNSIYIIEDISILANGLYYIVSPQINLEPLKFVKVN